ncbi:hypothetical protein [Candidatus Magnetominusculus dajiuhuensis]|uniref:hypothetical protein n=1 Tax=Candidatus Magnetominusculus dajiuhuensis TaxID=3137712 RepID=UPI003B43A601
MGELTNEERDTILISMNKSVKGLTESMAEFKKELAELRHDVDKKPDREEIGLIVDDCLTRKTFKLSETKRKAS